MEQDEALNPGGIRRIGSPAVVAGSQGQANAIAQAGLPLLMSVVSDPARFDGARILH